MAIPEARRVRLEAAKRLESKLAGPAFREKARSFLDGVNGGQGWKETADYLAIRYNTARLLLSDAKFAALICQLDAAARREARCAAEPTADQKAREHTPVASVPAPWMGNIGPDGLPVGISGGPPIVTPPPRDPRSFAYQPRPAGDPLHDAVEAANAAWDTHRRINWQNRYAAPSQLSRRSRRRF